MLIAIEPVVIDSQRVEQVDVSIAVSSTVAIRIQPVDKRGEPVGGPVAVYGGERDALPGAFLAALSVLAADVVTASPSPLRAAVRVEKVEPAAELRALAVEAAEAVEPVKEG